MKRRDFINACIAGFGGAIGSSLVWAWPRDEHSLLVSDALTEDNYELCYAISFRPPIAALFSLIIERNGKPITLAKRFAKAGLWSTVHGRYPVSVTSGDELHSFRLVADRALEGPVDIDAWSVEMARISDYTYYSRAQDSKSFNVNWEVDYTK